MNWGEIIATIGGLLVLALGLSALGDRFRELLDGAFGAQMRETFGSETGGTEADAAGRRVPDDLQ